MTRAHLTLAGLAAAGAALMLAGCRIIPETIPSDIYRLSLPVTDAPVPDAAAREYGAPTIMVSLPAAARVLGGNSILISRPDGSMAVAAGARWASSARSLVQDVLMETFEANAPQVAPLRPGDGIPGNFDLSVDLRHFEAEYDQGMEAPPLVRVSMGGRLISEARVLHGSTVITANTRAASNTMGAIVAAFNASTAQVAREMTEWTVARVDVAQAREAAAREAGR